MFGLLDGNVKNYLIIGLIAALLLVVGLWRLDHTVNVGLLSVASSKADVLKSRVATLEGQLTEVVETNKRCSALVEEQNSKVDAIAAAAAAREVSGSKAVEEARKYAADSRAKYAALLATPAAAGDQCLQLHDRMRQYLTMRRAEL